MRIKLWLFALICLSGGIGLIFMGGREYLHTRKLTAEGKAATATVIGRQERTIYRDSKSSHVTVAFQTESGERVTNEIMVTPDIYSQATKGSSISVIYYPKDPSICIIGNQPDLSSTRFVGGGVVLGIGFLLGVFLWKHPNAGVIRPPTEDEIAEKVRPEATGYAQKIVKNLAPLMVTKYEYETVDARRFTNLDLQFYETQRRFLESRGFKYLLDRENVTLRRSAHNPKTFARLMLREDGFVSAGMYHFKPPMASRLAGVKEQKVLDLTTAFDNGNFVCTSSAGDGPQLSHPAELNFFALPNATTFERMLMFHQQRVDQYIGRTGARPVPLDGLAGVTKIGDEITRLQAEHRQRVGMTAAEFANFSGGKQGERAADLLFEEVLREHKRTQGQAGA